MNERRQNARELSQEYRDTIHVMVAFYSQYPERFQDDQAKFRLFRRLAALEALADLFAVVASHTQQH